MMLWTEADLKRLATKFAEGRKKAREALRGLGKKRCLKCNGNGAVWASVALGSERTRRCPTCKGEGFTKC